MWSPRLLKLLQADFLVALLFTQCGVAGLYVVVDLIERLDFVIRNHVGAATLVRYFVYKLPLVVSQTLPVSVAIALLVTLLLRHRNNEILALQAAGVGPRRMAMLVSGATLLLCSVAFFWAEFVVPPSTRVAQDINLRDIKKRDRTKLFADKEIWFRGTKGIYHVAYVDRSRKALVGVWLFELAEGFRLHQVRHFPLVYWTTTGWSAPASRTTSVPLRQGTAPAAPDTGGVFVDLPTDFEEFAEVQREPEEQSLIDLWRQLAFLRALGLPSTRIRVDFYAKTALPFASLAVVLVLFPVNLRPTNGKRLAVALSTSAFLGFAYWVLLGTATSLGYAGTLPAPLAAWLANVVYASAGIALIMRA